MVFARTCIATIEMTTTNTRSCVAVTICSLNYLAKAAVFAESYHATHPDADLVILLVDRRQDVPPALSVPATILWVEDLGIPDIRKLAFSYDIIEFNTVVKPFLLRYLLASYDTVLYFDPDIYVYRYLTPVFDALAEGPIVVTPHTMTPILDGRMPDDRSLLRFGAFNLGFVGVSRCAEAEQFLDWWAARCSAFGFYEPQSGLAVDQKWIDLAPAYFPGLRILRDPGLNVAFWNLHERRLAVSSSGPRVNTSHHLYFVHFSSFNEHDPQAIAGKQTRYPSGSRYDFEPFAVDYAHELRRSKERIGSSSDLYGFDFFDDGTRVTATLRRVYAALLDRFPDENPFSPSSRVFAFANRHGLLGGKSTATPRFTFKDADRFRRFEPVLFSMLRMVLRVVGPDRYFALMRFMAHASSIRHQADMFS